MRLGLLLDLLTASAKFARLDPAMLAAHPDAKRHPAFHRKMVRCGVAIVRRIASAAVY